MDRTLGIVGCGRLGEALLTRLLATGGVAPDAVAVSVRRPGRAHELAERHGVAAGTDNAVPLARDVVVLGLKPQVLPGVLAASGRAVGDGALVVSLAAGVRLATLRDALPAHAHVVRVMSNTPALVGEAMSVVAGDLDDDGRAEVVEDLLAPLGRTTRIDESRFDAVTALSGSGPAYVFLLAEAMVDAGVAAGLPRDDATLLVTQTLVGSAALLADADGDAAALRAQVTSPGGTTAAGLRELEAAGLRAAVIDAVAAAARRGAQLG